MADGMTGWHDLTERERRDIILAGRRRKYAKRFPWHMHNIQHPRNELFVLIAKIGGARNCITHAKAGRLESPGLWWWRLQPASIVRQLGEHRLRHGL